MSDTSKFPDPTYKDTVLAPLFEGVKTHYAHHMAAINKAHLVMLGETGVLTPAQSAKIAHALKSIDQETDIDALEYTGEFEDYFFVVEAALKGRLGDLGGMLHTARSRNDMDHTLFKLALRSRTALMLGQLETLCSALIKKAQAEANTLIVAYTHGQPAQPTTFGHYLSAMIEVLLRDMERLNAAADGLEHCPMGAAAITTSGFPIDRNRMAALLGFESPLQNSYGCIASVDYVTGLYSAMKLVFLHLGRVIQDMGIWASFEVGQLYVPNSLVQISSIMPQKRNPVPIEHLRHLSSVTVGRCDTIVNTMHNTPFTDMNDSEGEVQQAGYAAFTSGGRVLELMTAFLPACSINSENVKRITDAACITITELADTLVRDEGVTFRQAHEVAATTAREVISARKPLTQGYAECAKAFNAEIGRNLSMSEAQFAIATSAEHFVAVRDRFGGPAPAALDGALMTYSAQLDDLIKASAHRVSRHKDAEGRLASAFNSLLES
ncbi:argininosuccinate lyase [Aliiroseovarius sp. 2305UL8-7]|uniref:argininosuccinate lyase n=1 Tax=Aliiroseovarius conchicola TaxID=3121637 RepID=UPI003526F71A